MSGKGRESPGTVPVKTRKSVCSAKPGKGGFGCRRIPVSSSTKHKILKILKDIAPSSTLGTHSATAKRGRNVCKRPPQALPGLMLPVSCCSDEASNDSRYYISSDSKIQVQMLGLVVNLVWLPIANRLPITSMLKP